MNNSRKPVKYAVIRSKTLKQRDESSYYLNPFINPHCAERLKNGCKHHFKLANFNLLHRKMINCRLHG